MRGQKQAAETEALIDSGSMECLVSPSFVERVGMTLIPLRRPIILRNADESENSQGRITHYVVLKYLWQGAVRLRLQKAYVASIGKHDVILGMTWLKKENLSIDWKTGNLIIQTMKAEPPPPPRCIRKNRPSCPSLNLCSVALEEEKKHVKCMLLAPTSTKTSPPL